jgi:hypothetical protein
MPTYSYSSVTTSEPWPTYVPSLIPLCFTFISPRENIAEVYEVPFPKDDISPADPLRVFLDIFDEGDCNILNTKMSMEDIWILLTRYSYTGNQLYPEKKWVDKEESACYYVANQLASHYTQRDDVCRRLKPSRVFFFGFTDSLLKVSPSGMS